MAASSNVIINLSRSSFPKSPVSNSSTSSMKTSNVCFTSFSSNFSKVGNVAENSRFPSSRRAYDDKDWSAKAKQTLEDDVESGKQRFEELKDSATDYVKGAAEDLKSAAASLGDKAKEGSDEVAKSAEGYVEKAKGYAGEATENAKDTAESIKKDAVDGAQSGAETVKDKVNEGTSKAGEVVKDLKV